MSKFLSSNEWQYRLARTIVQGVVGVLLANLDLLIGSAPIPIAYKPMIVALVMAILSPVMAALGGKEIEIQQGYNVDPIEELTEDAEVISYDYDCQNIEADE